MTNTWFAGNFCPRDASCSLEDGALKPSNGPKLRTLVLEEPRDIPFAATVQSFADESSFESTGTQSSEWLKCEGQLVAISQYTALFSLLGTSYGGDGRVNFGIPDLREDTSGKFFIFTVAHMR